MSAPFARNYPLINTILNVVFPADCVICGSRVTEWRSGAICSPCDDGFQTVASPLCPRCGSPRSHGQDGDDIDGDDRGPLCHRCRTGHAQFDFARSALVFDEPLRSAVHHFKYNDRVSLARPFARRLTECFERHPFTATRIVPVPLHRTRERKRGYNQAALLARRMGLEVQAGLVRRKRPTATQTGLTRSERATNVRSAFECGRPVEGPYLLLDDVMTTGATVNEVARVLRKNGASRVEVLTLTRATIAK